jgi:hypothetical protein
MYILRKLTFFLEVFYVIIVYLYIRDGIKNNFIPNDDWHVF